VLALLANSTYLLTHLLTCLLTYLLIAVSKSGLFDAFRFKCIDGTTKWCSKENGLSRFDVICCQMFCETDANHDGKICEEEIDSFILACNGGERGQYRSTRCSGARFSKNLRKNPKFSVSFS